jgi:hypothetical protein
MACGARPGTGAPAATYPKVVVRRRGTAASEPVLSCYDTT